MDWDCVHSPFIVCWQRLQSRACGVESLLISARFATSRAVAPEAMWETPVVFAVVSTRLCEDVSNSLLLRVLAFRARGVDLLAKDGVSLHLVFNFPDRVNHGRVIAASEELSDPHE